MADVKVLGKFGYVYDRSARGYWVGAVNAEGALDTSIIDLFFVKTVDDAKALRKILVGINVETLFIPILRQIYDAVALTPFSVTEIGVMFRLVETSMIRNERF